MGREKEGKGARKRKAMVKGMGKGVKVRGWGT